MTEPLISMKVKGLGTLIDELKALPDKTRKKIARKALRESAELLKQEVISRVPRKFGFLAASVRVKIAVNEKKERAEIIAGDRRAWYAHLVEYGFVHTGHGRKKADRKPTSRGRIEGKAFMRNSTEAKFEPTVDVFQNTVVETVTTEVGKGKP